MKEKEREKERKNKVTVLGRENVYKKKEKIFIQGKTTEHRLVKYI